AIVSATVSALIALAPRSALATGVALAAPAAAIVIPAMPPLVALAPRLPLPPRLALVPPRPRLACALLRPLDERRREIALRLGDPPLAELLAQHPRAHLIDRALGE